MEKTKSDKRANPYQAMPGRSFWAQAVGRRDAMLIDDLWTPKWPIRPGDRVATFGSCFAQHFGRALARRRYGWTNFEPAPEGLGEAGIETYNYNVFSARTGNIYTTNMLAQWCDWATGKTQPPEEIWQQDGRYFDPFRPAIEPGGFDSADEVRGSRALTIRAFREAMTRSDVFVFTLGLTESWRHRSAGHEYSVCPGTAAGTFDPQIHEFANLSYPEILDRLDAALACLVAVNPQVRVLLTVSPVPLTATATGEHVLVATTHSKSVLRAVAGAMAARHDFVDYFPSYEIITAPAFGGRFFAENKRNVTSEGVGHVMKQFFRAQDARFGDLGGAGESGAATGAVAPGAARGDGEAPGQDDLVCEEALLAAFAPKV